MTAISAWVPAVYGAGAMFLANKLDGSSEVIARTPYIDTDVYDDYTLPALLAFTSLTTGERYTPATLSEEFMDIEWFNDFDINPLSADGYNYYSTHREELANIVLAEAEAAALYATTAAQIATARTRWELAKVRLNAVIKGVKNSRF